MVCVGGGADGFDLCLNFDHGDEIGAVVIVGSEFAHDFVLSVCLEDELIDGAQNFLPGELVVEDVHLSEVVELHSSLKLESFVVGAAS
jgi:hypothetical protein